jgi:hypothetical protein
MHAWFTFKFDDFAYAFLSVLFEGVPFLLLGSLISGLVDVFVSSDRLAKMLPRNPSAAILFTGLLGLIFPMCECGSVIVIRRFIKKGLPLSCAVTYMLSSPIVSPIVALSTYAAFRGRDPLLMVCLRLGLGYLISVSVGFIVQRFQPASILQPSLVVDSRRKRSGLSFAAAPNSAEAIPADFSELAGSASFGRKIVLGIQSATADFLDVAFFFIIGIAIASIFNTAVDQSIINRFASAPLLAILALMVLAAILALCSTTDAFIAASFTSFPYEAKLAFLVFGAMFDVKLFWLYGLIFKRKFVVLLSLGLFIAVAFFCWRIGFVLHGLPVVPR